MATAKPGKTTTQGSPLKLRSALTRLIIPGKGKGVAPAPSTAKKFSTPIPTNTKNK